MRRGRYRAGGLFVRYRVEDPTAQSAISKPRILFDPSPAAGEPLVRLIFLLCILYQSFQMPSPYIARIRYVHGTNQGPNSFNHRSLSCFDTGSLVANRPSLVAGNPHAAMNSLLRIPLPIDNSGNRASWSSRRGVYALEDRYHEYQSIFPRALHTRAAARCRLQPARAR